jgi:cell division topological specificity factor
MNVMAWMDYFRRTRPGTANLAKDRLSIIVAREGRCTAKATYLPQLRQELLQVLAKYENLDLDQVTVNVESQGECEVLELNVILSDPDKVKKMGSSARHAPFFSEVKPERAALSDAR